MGNMNKKGMSMFEILIAVVVAIALFFLVVIFFTGTVGSAGKQTLKSTDVVNASECIPTQKLAGCSDVCEQACCRCPVYCGRADEIIRLGETCR